MRYSAVGSYMLVLTVLFFNRELQGVKTTVSPPTSLSLTLSLFPPHPPKNLLHASSVQLKRMPSASGFFYFIFKSPLSRRLTHDHFHAKIAALIVRVVVCAGWIRGFVLLPSTGGYANNHDANATPIFVLHCPLEAKRRYLSHWVHAGLTFMASVVVQAVHVTFLYVKSSQDKADCWSREVGGVVRLL